MKKNYLRGILGLLIMVVTAWGVHKVFTSSVNVHEVRRQLNSFSDFEIAVILGLSTVMMAVRAFRFHLLLKDAGQELTFWQTLKVFITGQAFSPLPAGEGIRPVLLKKEADIDLKESVTPMIVLGITEMAVAVLITLVGSVFLGILRTAALIAAVGVMGLIWLLVNQRAVRAIWSRLPNSPAVQKAGKAVMHSQKEVKAVLFHQHSWYPSSLFLINLGLALVTDLLGAGVIYLIARHFDLSLGYLLSLYVFAAATVLGELVPFSPGGIGATEGGMTGILVVSGLPLSPALLVVLLYRAATLVYGVILGLGFLALFYTGECVIRVRQVWVR